MNQRTMERRRLLRQIAVIAIPVAMQNLLTNTGSMVDTMMLAKLGETTVSAVGLCAQFASLFVSCYWGFIGGGTLFVAQYWGAKDDRGIRRAYGLSLCMILAVGMLFFVLAGLFPRAVMSVYTDKENLKQLGIQYLKIYAWVFPLQSIIVAMGMLLRSIERVKVPMIAGIASVFTNCFCNYVLIFGKFGAPALGAPGAAIGTVIANVVNLAVLVVYALVGKVPYVLQLHKCFDWGRGFVREYFGRSSLILCNEAGMGISTMLINVVLGRQSPAAIAASVIYRAIEAMVVAFFTGFSSAGSILVGKDVGAGEHEAAQKKTVFLVYLTSFCIFLCCSLIMVFHRPLFTALGLSGESFEICTVLCSIYCVVAVIRLGNWQHNDCFRAGGDPFFGTALEISFMYLLVVPSVYIAHFVFHAPFFAVFLFVYCDEPIRYVLMQRHLYSRKWIQPVSDKGRETIEAFREKYGVQMGYPLLNKLKRLLRR